MADGSPRRNDVLATDPESSVTIATTKSLNLPSIAIKRLFLTLSNSCHKKGGETSPQANPTSRTRDRSRLVDEPSETDSSDDDAGYGQELEAGTIEDLECKDESDTRFILYLVTLLKYHH